jgi:membrane-associated phospholipid phosphatase
MHLGVHYFTDVIAGTVLGVVVAAVWHGLRDRVSQASDGILPEASRVTAVPRQVTLVRFKLPLFPASAITVDGSP